MDIRGVLKYFSSKFFNWGNIIETYNLFLNSYNKTYFENDKKTMYYQKPSKDLIGVGAQTSV